MQEADLSPPGPVDQVPLILGSDVRVNPGPGLRGLWLLLGPRKWLFLPSLANVSNSIPGFVSYCRVRGESPRAVTPFSLHLWLRPRLAGAAPGSRGADCAAEDGQTREGLCRPALSPGRNSEINKGKGVRENSELQNSLRGEGGREGALHSSLQKGPPWSH